MTTTPQIIRQLRDAEIPALGYGTYQLRGDSCYRMVRMALAAGYRHLDTARLYQNEVEIGQALADSPVPRDQIFLTTKVWYDDLSPEGVRRQCEGSLADLATPYVDLLLIHWPNEAFPLAKTLAEMVRLQEEGKVKHLGVSNFPAKLVYEANEHARIVCNQIEYHPFLRQTAVLQAAEDTDAVVTAYSPLVRGEVADDPVLREIAESHKKTPAQVTLRWLLQQERVCTIPKTANPQRLEENLAVFDFELSTEEMRRIDGLEKGRRLSDPDFAPRWDPS